MRSIRAEQVGLSKEDIQKIADRLWKKELTLQKKNPICSGCSVKVGEKHEDGCCWIINENETWNGLWPGTKECYLRLYVYYMTERDEVITSLRSKKWSFDLNRIATEMRRR